MLGRSISLMTKSYRRDACHKASESFYEPPAKLAILVTHSVVDKGIRII